MIIRIACLAVPVIALASLIACAAPEVVDPSSSDEVKEGKKEQKAPSDDAGAAATGKTGSTAPASAPDGGRAPASTKGGGTARPAIPGDPTCVAKCNAQVKAKCDEQDDFCDILCGETSSAFVDCLAAAPTCAKADWIACDPQDSATNTKGEKK